MPVTIGKRPDNDFTNPLGMLSDCHRRIEAFLSALRRLAGETQGGRLSRPQVRDLEAALKYFRDSGPRHTEDEEESLFPILQQSQDEAVKQALPLIERLQSEHGQAELAHLRVDQLGRRWLEKGELEPEAAAEIGETLEELAVLYKEHIALEDDVLFPLAEKTLSAAEVKGIGCEMASRRGIDLDTCKV
jgi:hemerythrin-like domain-containing protein